MILRHAFPSGFNSCQTLANILDGYIRFIQRRHCKTHMNFRFINGTQNLQLITFSNKSEDSSYQTSLLVHK
jgi:hypothetical protein